VKSFAGAHNLRNYEGKCENLHGHNWKVEAYLKGTELDETEMLVDFKIFKKRLNEILENIARYIYENLKITFGEMTERVIVWETDIQCAEYWEE